MRSQIKGLVYFFFANMRHSMIIFWSILLATALLSLVASYLLRDTDGVMMVTLTAPIYVYFSIYGYIVVKNWLPFMIKLGATRKNIFLSFALYFTVLTALFSVMALLIQVILTPVARKLNLEIFSFVHLAQFLDNAWYERLFIDIILSIFLFVTSFFIGIVNYRYGLLISSSLAGLLFLFVMLAMFYGWLGKFFVYIYKHFDVFLFVILGLVAIIIYGITWLFLRKATIIKVR